MNKPNEIRIKSNSSSSEKKRREAFYRQFTQCPIPQDELLRNLNLFINRQTISRMLFFHELYKKIVPVHGIIIEFGVRWGADLTLLASLRGIYEPYNYNRKIVGFDTFSGFPCVSDKDGDDEIASPGAYGVTPDYDAYLETVLSYHETESPISHIKKYELVKGDATQTLGKYLADHPETIIALAYFDFDLYEPTKKCLELIRPHLTKGSVVGFDELNCPDFPGETQAVKDVFGLDQYAIRRLPSNPNPSFIVIE
ncbi:MAG: TylF/MycF family methyltransferase [Desulfobacterales bacterium]|nr:TylF/MycF family methyltransferase [Desulfobacterales bacterium]